MANMKNCKYCRSQIDSRAKICPVCKKKQSSALGWLLLVLAAVIILPVGLIISVAFIRGYYYAFNGNSISREAEKMPESDYKAACKAVSYDDIARDKDGLKGEKVTFTGKIIQATSGTYRMNVTKGEYGFYSDTILFEVDEKKLSKNILEDDIVTIWGESKGMYTYKAVLGNQITVPRIQVVYIENHGKESETTSN